MNVTFKTAIFGLSKDGSIKCLVKPYYSSEEITRIINSGVYKYLCDIYSNKRKFWYSFTKDGGTTYLPENEVPKELLATVLLMQD